MYLSNQIARAFCQTHYPPGEIVVGTSRNNGLSAFEKLTNEVVRHRVMCFLNIRDGRSVSQVSRHFWHCLNQGEFWRNSILLDRNLYGIGSWAKTQQAGALAASEWRRLTDMPRIHQIPWEPQLNLRRHMAEVNGMAVLPDGRLVSASDDGTVRVWSANGRSRILATLDDQLFCLALCPNGQIAVGGRLGHVSILSADGRFSHELPHIGQVHSLVAFPDGRIASGSVDGTVRLSFPDGSQFRVLRGHTARVNQLVVLPNGRLVSGSSDATMRIWSPDGQSQELGKHEAGVTCLSVFPDGRLVSGLANGTVRISSPGGQSQELGKHEAMVTCLAVFPDGRIASGSTDSTVRIWSPAGQFQVLPGHITDRVYSLLVLPDGRLISGLAKGTMRIWRPRPQPRAIATRPPLYLRIAGRMRKSRLLLIAIMTVAVGVLMRIVITSRRGR